MKILVVDDHPLIREALRLVLKGLDAAMYLLEAANRDSALAISSEHPDLSLILLDLTLPGANEFDLLRELREQYPAVPVVVLSASDQADVVTSALDAGAMGFIPKSSPNEVLVGALRLVLSGGVYLPPTVLRQPAGPGAGARPPGRGYRDLGLTERQAQVLALLIQGKPNKLICRELNLAEGTVKIHITAILKALKVANRTQAVIAVGMLGLKLPQIHQAVRTRDNNIKPGV